MSVMARTTIAERAPRTYPAGRRCEREGCDTVLSVYNPEPTCRAHTGPRPVVGNRARGRRST